MAQNNQGVLQPPRFNPPVVAAQGQNLPKLKSIHLNTIPAFHGDPQRLLEFIKICGKLQEHFGDRVNPHNYQNQLLITSFLAKVLGDCKVQISNVPIETWDDLKAAFLEAYSDKRDSFTLTHELAKTRQQPSENAFNFLAEFRYPTPPCLHWKVRDPRRRSHSVVPT